MSLRSLDAKFRSAVTWRVLGVALCCWVAGVIAFAGLAAYDDRLELYRWTVLALLLVGVPMMIAAIAYAGILLGPKGRKWLIVTVISLAIGLAGLLAYDATNRDGNASEKAASIIATPSPERRAECERKCAGNPNEYCQIVCEMHER